MESEIIGTYFCNPHHCGIILKTQEGLYIIVNDGDLRYYYDYNSEWCHECKVYIWPVL